MALKFLLGFLTSFVGTIPPSMLNLTTLKISLEKGKRKSYFFALGVSLIIFIQAYISLLFANYIHNNTSIEKYIQITGITVFTLLSTYFFYSAFKEKNNTKTSKLSKKNTFFFGLFLASLNMFAIPFYCSVGSTLNLYGWLDYTQTNILIFDLGSTIGVFSLLVIYANSAILIQKRIALFSKNFNYILGTITGVVAIITFISIL